jgi:predicted esterase
VKRGACLLIACAFSLNAGAEATLLERSATTTELFGSESARDLARTLPVDRAVRFRLRLPDGARNGGRSPSGVVVFVKPESSGTFPANWGDAFDTRNLIWISADDAGNRTPTATRILAAIMGVALAGKAAKVDASRVYIAGLSGGGRVASQAITRYPGQFTGALCIVGADYFLPDEPLKSRVLERRLVFITGARDFNRREILQVFERYGKAGASHIKLLDFPRLGHEYPSGEELGQALDFLDSR